MKKADRCQKKLSLNQCNFLPSCLWPEGPLRVFYLFSFFFLFFFEKEKKKPALRYTVNHNAQGGAELVREKGGLWKHIYYFPASVRLLMFFLDQDTVLKNLVHFLHFRKHFHNFKYNNFLFGKTQRIIRVYLDFIYPFSYPERKGLKKKGGAPIQLMVGPLASDPKWVLIGVVNSVSAQGLWFTASLVWLQESSTHILCLFSCLFCLPLMAEIVNINGVPKKSLPSLTYGTIKKKDRILFEMEAQSISNTLKCIDENIKDLYGMPKLEELNTEVSLRLFVLLYQKC